jgi:hypothetical protein
VGNYVRVALHSQVANSQIVRQQDQHVRRQVGIALAPRTRGHRCCSGRRGRGRCALCIRNSVGVVKTPSPHAILVSHRRHVTVALLAPIDQEADGGFAGRLVDCERATRGKGLALALALIDCVLRDKRFGPRKVSDGCGTVKGTRAVAVAATHTTPRCRSPLARVRSVVLLWTFCDTHTGRCVDVRRLQTCSVDTDCGQGCGEDTNSDSERQVLVRVCTLISIRGRSAQRQLAVRHGAADGRVMSCLVALTACQALPPHDDVCSDSRPPSRLAVSVATALAASLMRSVVCEPESAINNAGNLYGIINICRFSTPFLTRESRIFGTEAF